MYPIFCQSLLLQDNPIEKFSDWKHKDDYKDDDLKSEGQPIYDVCPDDLDQIYRRPQIEFCTNNWKWGEITGRDFNIFFSGKSRSTIFIK